MTNGDLKEAVEFFDTFVNDVLVGKAEEHTPLEVVKNYNVIKNQLAELLVEKE